jgi:hypothetical protein
VAGGTSQVAVVPARLWISEVVPVPLLVEVIGEPGVGKTHFSLTFPKPFLFDTTPKREAEVIVYKLHGAEAKKRYMWATKYEQLLAGIKEVVKRDDVRTVIIDTGADLQSMAVEYELQKKDRERLMPFEYGRIREMIDEDVIELVINSGKHLVMTAQMDDEYVNGQKTGRRVPKGYKRMAFQSDVRIFITISVAELTIMPGGLSFDVVYGKTMQPKRTAVVVKNRFVDITTTGYQKLEGNFTFADLVKLIPQEFWDVIFQPEDLEVVKTAPRVQR